MLVAVGAEDDWALAVHRLQTVCVELRLLLALQRAMAGRLSLHQRQRPAVITPQHVVNEALAGAIRHAGDFVFSHIGPIRIPPHLPQ